MSVYCLLIFYNNYLISSCHRFKDNIRQERGMKRKKGRKYVVIIDTDKLFLDFDFQIFKIEIYF